MEWHLGIFQFFSKYPIKEYNPSPHEKRIIDILAQENLLQQGEKQNALVRIDKPKLRDIPSFIKKAQTENLQLQSQVEQQNVNGRRKNDLPNRIDKNSPSAVLISRLRSCKDLIIKISQKDDVEKTIQAEQEDVVK